MMENASYHRSNAVKDLIECLEIPVIFSAPYSPLSSPIELFFGALKSYRMTFEEVEAFK